LALVFAFSQQKAWLKLLLDWALRPFVPGGTKGRDRGSGGEIADPAARFAEDFQSALPTISTQVTRRQQSFGKKRIDGDCGEPGLAFGRSPALHDLRGGHIAQGAVRELVEDLEVFPVSLVDLFEVPGSRYNFRITFAGAWASLQEHQRPHIHLSAGQDLALAEQGIRRDPNTSLKASEISQPEIPAESHAPRVLSNWHIEQYQAPNSIPAAGPLNLGDPPAQGMDASLFGEAIQSVTWMRGIALEKFISLQFLELDLKAIAVNPSLK